MGQLSTTTSAPPSPERERIRARRSRAAEPTAVVSGLAQALANLDASVTAAQRGRADPTGQAPPAAAPASSASIETMCTEWRALRAEHAEIRAALRGPAREAAPLPLPQVAFTVTAIVVMWAAVLVLKTEAASVPLVVLAMAHLTGCIVMLAFGRAQPLPGPHKTGETKP